jgi:hypothetical protein
MLLNMLEWFQVEYGYSEDSQQNGIQVEWLCRRLSTAQPFNLDVYAVEYFE